MDYSSIVADIAQLFVDEGVDAYLHKQELSDFNPLTGSSGSDYADSVKIRVVYSSVNTRWAQRFTMEAEDVVALVSPTSTEPEKNDLVSDDDVEGTAWTVVARTLVKPTDTVLLYMCHMRKQ